MRGRRLLAVAVVTTAVTSAPAWAAPHGHLHRAELSVTADGTRSVTFRLLSAATIDGKALRGRAGVTRRVLDPAGRYGAVFVSRGRSFVFGLVMDSDMAGPLVLGDNAVTMKPGVYTVTVAGDKPVAVHLPLSNSAYSYGLVATGAAHVQRVSTDAQLAPDVGYASVAVKVGRQQGVLVADTVRTSTATVAVRQDICIKTSAGPCAPTTAEPGGGGGVFVTPQPGESAYGAAIFTAPGGLAAGNYFATVDDVAVAAGSQSQVVTYVVG